MDLARIKGNVAKMASMNAPEADIDGYIASEGATVDDVKNFGSQPKGFIDSVADDMRQRGAQLANSINARDTGQQTDAETGMQKVGIELGAAGDVIGQGVKSAVKAGYGMLPENARQAFEQQQAAAAGSPAGRAELGALNKAGQMYGQFAENNPRAARNLEAVGNIAAAFVPVKGKSAAGLTRDTAELAINAGNRLAPRHPLPTIEHLGDLSTNLYKKSELEGGVAPPEFANEFVKQANTVRPTSDKAAAIRGKSPIQDVLDSIDTFKDKSFSMPEIDEVDKELTRKINSFLDGGLATPESRDVQQIQNKFRELVDKTDLPGVPSWKDAKSAFATKKRLQDIQDIFDNAKNRPNEATAIQAGFRRIAEDDARMRGYSKEARKYIVKAARNNNSVDALKLMGSRLLPMVVGSAGGGAGAAAATAAGGTAARSIAAGIKASQGNKVAVQVTKDFMRKASPETKAELMAKLLNKKPQHPVNTVIQPFIPKPQLLLPAPDKSPIAYGERPENWRKVGDGSIATPAPAKTKLLPAPESVTAVDRSGAARIMTDSERQSAEKARLSGIETGLTPDVRAVQLKNETNKAYEIRQKQLNQTRTEQIAEMLKQNQLTIPEMLNLSKQKSKDIAEILGKNPESSNLGKALEEAIKKKK